jgi:ketosteroid isomerase-like protein
MTYRRVIFAYGIVIFLCFSSLTYGQDLDDLKASFNAEIEALDSRNLDAAVALVHDGIVLFSLFSPFPVDGKDEFRQAIQEYFANYEQATFAPSNPQFHIVGNTGIAWGYYQLSAKLKDGPSGYFHGRYLFTYTQSEGKWLMISLHVSPLAAASTQHPPL